MQRQPEYRIGNVSVKPGPLTLQLTVLVDGFPAIAHLKRGDAFRLADAIRTIAKEVKPT